MVKRCSAAAGSHKKAEGYRLKVVGKACAAIFALATIGIISGCAGPRVVFLPAADAPVRAGPDMNGRVYVWTGGTWELSRNSVTVPEDIDVAGLRDRLGLSQTRFAATFGLDVDAVQAWEQNRRRPDRTARILLAVIAKEPDAVRRALAG